MKIVFLSTILFHGAVWAASSQVQSLRQHQQQEQNESIGTLESNELLQGRILQPERTGPAPEVCDRFLADPIKDTTTFPETKSNNIPAVKPFCLTFDEGLGTQGFAPCPGVYNNIIVQQSVSNTNGDPTFGPSAGGIDFYLHQVDQSGGSLGCGTGSDYTGDWSAMACEDGCHEICFDFRVLYDGCNGAAYPACTETNAAGLPYAPITPRIIIQGGAPNYYRAVLSATFTVTDDDGDNGGWHTVCGRIGPLNSDGSLPTGGNGVWTLAGAPCDVLAGVPCGSNPVPDPADAWCELWSNVAAIQTPIDPTANPAERFGYDNICIKEIEGCGKVCEPEPLCYWEHDVGCRRFKKYERELAELYEKLGIRYFDEHFCHCELMEKCCPDRCDMAEQEWVALLLNIASGKLELDCCVDECHGNDDSAVTVLTAVQKINHFMSKHPRSEYHCTRAMALASGINHGNLLCKDQ